jgi:hypothetical protein
MVTVKRTPAIPGWFVLVSMLVACALIRSRVTDVVAAVTAALLAAELDRSGRVLAVRIVRAGTYLLPTDRRTDHFDEWRDHVLTVGEVGLRPVWAALGIAFVAAPRLALTVRGQRAIAACLLGLIGACLGFQRELLRRADGRRGWVTYFIRVQLLQMGVFVVPVYAAVLMRARTRAVPSRLWYVGGFGLWAALIIAMTKTPMLSLEFFLAAQLAMLAANVCLLARAEWFLDKAQSGIALAQKLRR